MNVALGLILPIMLALFFGWLAPRGYRSHRVWLKWPVTVGAGLLAILSALAGALAVLGLYRLHTPETRAITAVELSHSPEAIQQGERLAHLCITCHSSTGERLDG